MTTRGSSKPLNISDITNFKRVETWTPTLSFGGAATGMTYTRQIGRFMKLGSLVIATADILLSAKGSSTGAATIVLPVACLNISNMSQSATVGYTNITFTNGVTLWLSPGTTTLNIYDYSSALTDTAFANTSEILFTATYLTDA